MPIPLNSPTFSKAIETRCRRVAATFAQRYYPVFLENPSALGSWYAKKFSLRHSHAQQKRCNDATKITTILTESSNVIAHIYVDKMYVKVLIFPFDDNEENNNRRFNPSYTYKTTINVSFQLSLELKDGTSTNATHTVQLVDSQPNVFAITKDRLQYENDATMSEDDEDEEEAYKYKMFTKQQGAGGASKLLSVSELFQKNNSNKGDAEHIAASAAKTKPREKVKEELLAISSAAAAVAAMADKKNDDWFRKHIVPVEETHVEANKNVSYADILRANKKANQSSAMVVSPSKPIAGNKGKEVRPLVVKAATGNKQGADAKRKAKETEN